MEQSNEKKEEAVNINWLQVLAFGCAVDNVNEQNQVLKATSVFEVLP